MKKHDDHLCIKYILYNIICVCEYDNILYTYKRALLLIIIIIIRHDRHRITDIVVFRPVTTCRKMIKLYIYILHEYIILGRLYDINYYIIIVIMTTMRNGFRTNF